MSAAVRSDAAVDTPVAIEADHVQMVGYHDLAGRPGLKLAVHDAGGRRYLYVGSLYEPGWSVLDVTDAANPTLESFIAGPANTWTLQVQAADGLLVTGYEVPRPGWTDSVEGALAGVQLWDLTADPLHPPPLGRFETGGTGCHRNFYNGGDVVALATNLPGFVHRLPVFVDISDRSAPREISRWWWPGQQLDAPGANPDGVYLHGPVHIEGDRAYLSYGQVGMVVLDVSDLARPELVTHVSFGDLGSRRPGCHSVVPVPGSDLVIVNSEAHQDHAGDVDPLNFTFVLRRFADDDYRVISSFPMPRPASDLPYRNYYDKGGRFGPHNQHHSQHHPLHAITGDLVFMTYFNAGLRVFSIEDPMMPVEVGCFVPDDPPLRRGPKPDALVTQFEDVLVDDRGIVYCTDKNRGVFLLRYDGFDGAARS